MVQEPLCTTTRPDGMVSLTNMPRGCHVLRMSTYWDMQFLLQQQANPMVTGSQVWWRHLGCTTNPAKAHLKWVDRQGTTPGLIPMLASPSDSTIQIGQELHIVFHDVGICMHAYKYRGSWANHRRVRVMMTNHNRTLEGNRHRCDRCGKVGAWHSGLRGKQWTTQRFCSLHCAVSTKIRRTLVNVDPPPAV